jgi:hypothetical protein
MILQSVLSLARRVLVPNEARRTASQARPRLEEYDVAHVDFVGEQDGPVERQLTAKLSAIFDDDHCVNRAYLVRATLDGEATVLLGLQTDGPDSQDLVARIQDAFKTIFASSQHLDVLFLSDEQVRSVGRVSRPFHIRWLAR